MQRTFLMLSIGLLFAPGAARGEKAAAEKAKLQGTWTQVSAKYDGKAVDVQATVVIAGDRLTIKTKDQTLERQLILNPTKKPMWMDLLVLRGPDKDKKMLGIYQLDEDKLTICRAMPDQPRPADFESKPGSRVLLVVLKREKP